MRLVVRGQSVYYGLDLFDCAVEEDSASLGDVDCIVLSLHCLHLGGPRRLLGVRLGLLVHSQGYQTRGQR